MKTTPGVIIDVDGVLVDSYEAHFQSYQKVGNKHQLAAADLLVHSLQEYSVKILQELVERNAARYQSVYDFMAARLKSFTMTDKVNCSVG